MLGAGFIKRTSCLCCTMLWYFKSYLYTMAMKSMIVAASLLLGSVHGITTEGMLAAPRRSTGILSAKGVRIDASHMYPSMIHADPFARIEPCSPKQNTTGRPPKQHLPGTSLTQRLATPPKHHLAAQCLKSFGLAIVMTASSTSTQRTRRFPAVSHCTRQI